MSRFILAGLLAFLAGSRASACDRTTTAVAIVPQTAVVSPLIVLPQIVAPQVVAPAQVLAPSAIVVPQVKRAVTKPLRARSVFRARTVIR